MTLSGFKSSNHPQQTGKREPGEPLFDVQGSRDVTDEVDDRSTHPENFDPLNERFRFTLDVAAAPHNAKCDRFYTREDDGLSQWWGLNWSSERERVWCNPPYSDCGAWVEKAWQEWRFGRCEVIVMLLPANRTEQAWWQDHVEPYRDRPDSPLRVEFLRGRMRFIRPNAEIGPKGDRPPFGCCLLIWENR